MEIKKMQEWKWQINLTSMDFITASMSLCMCLLLLKQLHQDNNDQQCVYSTQYVL